MIGRRIPDAEAGSYPAHEPGDYGRIGAEWWVFPPPSERYPNAEVAMLDSRWQIIEHANGTITVGPSIHELPKREGEPSRYHGFLTNGVWSEV